VITFGVWVALVMRAGQNKRSHQEGGMSKVKLKFDNRIAQRGLSCQWVCAADESDGTHLTARWMRLARKKRGAPPAGAAIAYLARITHAEVSGQTQC
jgi:hypothetical protein